MSANGAAGVLDAGVVLGFSDRLHRSHDPARALLARGGRGELSLLISAVNLAEVYEVGRPLLTRSGVDLLSLLAFYEVKVHVPDAATARRAAALSSAGRASLADRFALATAQETGGRLYTTDRALARTALTRRIPTTLF